MDQYQQQQHIAGLMAGMGAFFFLIVLVFAIFFVFCFWRIFTKAGLAGPLALLVLIPGLGSLVVALYPRVRALERCTRAATIRSAAPELSAAVSAGAARTTIPTLAHTRKRRSRLQKFAPVSWVCPNE